MKMVRILTSKGIYYYSITGKTAAILESDKLKEILKYKLIIIPSTEVSFYGYETVVIGSPTYGRGTPPEYFLGLLPQLRQLKGKNIGLFGSGNTIYGDDFCGALDVFEEILSPKNRIIFKYKFEGYPKDSDIENLTQLILEA
jgi:flavodoxin